MLLKKRNLDEEWLTKYVVGANENPPKNPEKITKEGESDGNKHGQCWNREASSNIYNITPKSEQVGISYLVDENKMYRPTYILREIKRSVVLSLNFNLFTNNVSIMSNTVMAWIYGYG